MSELAPFLLSLRVAALATVLIVAVGVPVAWVLAQPGITSAIIGASRPDQLDATLAGAELEVLIGGRAVSRTLAPA